MKLIVKNFGPIKDASIDIKPLTVFAGPGNRGKSYLATLLHTILQTHLMSESIDLRHLEESERVYELIKPGEDSTSDSQFVSLIDELLAYYFESFGKIWREKVDYYFGEIGEHLLKNKPQILVANNDESTVVDLITPANSRFQQLSKNIIIQNLTEYMESPESSKMPFSFFESFLSFTITKTILGIPDFPDPTDKNVRYLPAVRSGIMQSHRLMVHLLVQGATFVGRRKQAAIPSFHGIFADFLNHVNGIDKENLHSSQDKERQSIVQLADDVETRLLEGKVKVTLSPTGAPDFSYQFTQANKKHEISLMHTSSTVSELSPFVLFLRYYLEKGGFLIFEEPEAHLHPEAQQRITALLVHLMQQGVNVLITTHSGIILDELNNCVAVQRLWDKAKKKDNEKKADDIIESLKKRYPQSPALTAPLDKDKFAVYDFGVVDEASNNTKVQTVEWGGGVGYTPKRHYKVDNQQYEVGSDIYDYDEELDA